MQELMSLFSKVPDYFLNKLQLTDPLVMVIFSLHATLAVLGWASRSKPLMQLVLLLVGLVIVMMTR